MKQFILAAVIMIPAAVYAEEHSNIKGQLVPVGDKNQYEYAIKRWNIGLNPMVLPLDSVSASASYAFTSNIAARVSGLYMKGSSNKPQGSIGLPVYFAKAYSGFFVEPGLDSKAGVYSALGYHWMWDSGFNMHLSMGVGKKEAVSTFQVSYAFGT